MSEVMIEMKAWYPQGLLIEHFLPTAVAFDLTFFPVIIPLLAYFFDVRRQPLNDICGGKKHLLTYQGQPIHMGFS